MSTDSRLVIAQGTDASTLDPHAHSETTTGNILLQVYDSLLRRNAAMELEPWLATQWRHVSDTVVEFTLRDGVVFHNGEPFDGESVKFSIERMVDPGREPKFPPFGRFSSISHVEIEDRLTVRVVTHYPDPNLLAQLTGLMMLPPRYFADVGETEFGDVPCGTGPYRYKAWYKEQGVVELVAFDEYWRGRPGVEAVTFRAVPSGRDRVNGLLDGTIDLAVNLPPLEKGRVEADGALQVLGTPSVGIIYIGINTHHPVLRDERIRQALAHGIDVSELIEEELAGCGSPLNGPVYPQAFGVDSQVSPIPYDPDRARSLLREAGYHHGVELRLEVPDGRFTQDKEICLRIARQLERIGIRLHVDIQPWPTFISRFRNHEYDQLYYVGWGNTSFDPDEVYRNAFTHPSPWNPTHYHHDELAAIAKEAGAILESSRRQELYRRALTIFRQELPWIVLFQQYDLYGLHCRWTWQPRMDELIYVYDIGKASETAAAG